MIKAVAEPPQFSLKNNTISCHYSATEQDVKPRILHFLKETKTNT